MHTHLDAVDAAVASGRGILQPSHQPLVELVRALARQVDASGTGGPSARLGAAYLSALKDLSRALNTVQAQPQANRVDALLARRSASG